MLKYTYNPFYMRVRRSGFLYVFYILLLASSLTLLYNHHYPFHSKRHILHISLHHSHALTHEEVEHIEENYRNVPLKFWLHVRNQRKVYEFNETCAPIPNLLELDMSNTFWQVAKFKNATIQLLNAYYDPRNITTGENVRLPCMIDRKEIRFESYCQLWFEDERHPAITKVETIHYTWYKEWGVHEDLEYGPYLIECRIPKSHEGLVPKAVSIVENQCDAARNLMKVINNQPAVEKKNFAVCVKALDFLQDQSARLVEWFEFLFLMGVDKIFVYKLQPHPNIQKVLKHYEKLGKIVVRDTTLVESESNLPYLQHMYIMTHSDRHYFNEVIEYNDCFYSNINLYNYIVLLDTDEIILPQMDDNWEGLLTRVKKRLKPDEIAASFNVRNVYFLDDMMPEGLYPDIPPYMHMLQHVHRSFNFTPPGHYLKTFYSTDHVIACQNHLPFYTREGTLDTFDVETDEAHMQHYRGYCQQADCDMYRIHIVKDIGIWRYKDILIQRTNHVLDKCGLLV